MKPRNYHAARRAAGLCTTCGEHPPKGKGVRCAGCSNTRRTSDLAYRARVKQEVLDHYGPGCVLCPVSNQLLLTIDHIAGAGNRHRESLNLGRGHQFYLWLRSQGLPTGYRTLCWNCNCRRQCTKPDNLARKEAVLAHYGRACAHCGISDSDVLTLDHIEGGGNKHRKDLNVGAGWRFYSWLQSHEFPSGFQTLCYNCNIGRALAGMERISLIDVQEGVDDQLLPEVAAL